MKYIALLLLLLVAGCSAPWHYNRAVKKDFDFVRKTIQAEVRYIYKDSTVIHINDSTRIVTNFVDVEVPIEVPLTGTEKRIANKLAREELKRERLRTDSLKAENAKRELENKNLREENKRIKAETKLLKEQIRGEKKENRSKSWQWFLDNWWLLLIISAAILVGARFLKR